MTSILQGLTHILFDELSSNEEDEDFEIVYPSLDHLVQPSIEEEVLLDDEVEVRELRSCMAS